MIMFIVKPYTIEPLGIAYLSAYLKNAGCDHVLCLATSDIIDKIKYYKPTYLAYSVTTGEHAFYRELNNELKRHIKWECYSVFGGPHPTFIPEFVNDDGVDMCCIGEGFDSMVALAKMGARPSNIVTKEDREYKLVQFDKRDLLFPNRDIIYQFPRNYRNPIRSVMCSFFCYFNCTYCYNSRYKESYGVTKPQLRPVDSVVEEVYDVLRYPTKLLFMQDDIFPVFDREWVEDFIDKYRKVRVPFHIQLRPEFVNDDTMRQLKGVGLHGVTFAIESGNSDVRSNLLNRKISDRTILKAAETIHRHNLRLRTECMIGIPGETRADVRRTIDITSRCSPVIGWASLYQPYPGTQLGDYCVQNGMVIGSQDALPGSFFDSYRLVSPYARYFETAHHFFPLLARFPFLEPVVPLLARLPLEPIYKKFYRIYKARLYRKLYEID